MCTIFIIAPPTKHTNNQELTQPQLEDLWDNISGDLSAMIQGRVELQPQGIIRPFDAASDTSIDDQR